MAAISKRNDADAEIKEIKKVWKESTKRKRKNFVNLILISTSFQGVPTIFHKGIFLKQTTYIKN